MMVKPICMWFRPTLCTSKSPPATLQYHHCHGKLYPQHFAGNGPTTHGQGLISSGLKHLLLNCPVCREATSPERPSIFAHKLLMRCFVSTLIQTQCGGSLSRKWWSILKKDSFFRFSFLAQHMPCPSTALLVLKRLSVVHSKRDWS